MNKSAGALKAKSWEDDTMPQFLARYSTEGACEEATVGGEVSRRLPLSQARA